MDVTERVDLLFDGPSVPAGTVTVVGVYAPEPDDDWLGAPLTGRVGREVQDVGLATDDWVTVEDTVLGSIRRDVVPRHELGRLAAGHRRP